MMDYVIGYAISVFVIQAFVAFRNPDSNFRGIWILCMIWPISLLIVALASMEPIVAKVTGIHIVLSDNEKFFNFRFSTNPKVKGFAFAVAHVEFQFYKIIKK